MSFVEYQKSKGKNFYKLWQLSNMSINPRLVWEKKKRIITSEISSILVQCSLKCGVVFFASDNFQGIFVDSRFMMFTKVLIKELACILIHVHKIFNYTVFFRVLLLMYLVIVEKKLYHSCDQETFGIALSKKLPKLWRKSLPSKYPFLTLLLNKKNKNEYAEYHGISIPFKRKVHSKQSLFSLVWAMELGIISTCFGKGKFFSKNSNLTNLVKIQR